MLKSLCDNPRENRTLILFSQHCISADSATGHSELSSFGKQSVRAADLTFTYGSQVFIVKATGTQSFCHFLTQMYQLTFVTNISDPIN